METVEPIRSKKQIDNMKRYLKETSLRNWLLFTLGINSGLRIGDLLQLTVEEVKDCERISIRANKKPARQKTSPYPIPARKPLSNT